MNNLERCHKLPEKGELVLVLDQTGTDEEYETYRSKVISSGGRIRRVEDLTGLARHLSVYNPSFIIVLKREHL